MKEIVDMRYSFMSDEEPTDAQLQVIMEGVAKEARRQTAYAEQKVRENIERLCALHVKSV
jgi:hypothetical protein